MPSKKLRERRLERRAAAKGGAELVTKNDVPPEGSAPTNAKETVTDKKREASVSASPPPLMPSQGDRTRMSFAEACKVGFGVRFQRMSPTEEPRQPKILINLDEVEPSTKSVWNGRGNFDWKRGARGEAAAGAPTKSTEAAAEKAKAKAEEVEFVPLPPASTPPPPPIPTTQFPYRFSDVATGKYPEAVRPKEPVNAAAAVAPEAVPVKREVLSEHGPMLELGKCVPPKKREQSSGGEPATRISVPASNSDIGTQTLISPTPKTTELVLNIAPNKKVEGSKVKKSEVKGRVRRDERKSAHTLEPIPEETEAGPESLEAIPIPPGCTSIAKEVKVNTALVGPLDESAHPVPVKKVEESTGVQEAEEVDRKVESETMSSGVILEEETEGEEPIAVGPAPTPAQQQPPPPPPPPTCTCCRVHFPQPPAQAPVPPIPSVIPTYYQPHHSTFIFMNPFGLPPPQAPLFSQCVPAPPPPPAPETCDCVSTQATVGSLQNFSPLELFQSHILVRIALRRLRSKTCRNNCLLLDPEMEVLHQAFFSDQILKEVRDSEVRIREEITLDEVFVPLEVDNFILIGDEDKISSLFKCLEERDEKEIDLIVVLKGKYRDERGILLEDAILTGPTFVENLIGGLTRDVLSQEFQRLLDDPTPFCKCASGQNGTAMEQEQQEPRELGTAPMEGPVYNL